MQFYEFEGKMVNASTLRRLRGKNEKKKVELIKKVKEDNIEVKSKEAEKTKKA